MENTLMREFMENFGSWFILFLCCGWPLTWAVISVWAYQRYQARGLAGFIPRVRSRGQYDY
jgi:hypothetical protein